MFSAAGLNKTWPTFLHGVSSALCVARAHNDDSYLPCPLNLPTGATSSGSSASERTEKLSGTLHRHTFPSSLALARMSSLKGFQSWSSTAAVCPLNNGMTSGIFPRSSRGMTANAPPPDASQLTDRYLGLHFTRLVSQAFLLMRMLS